jgi:hypothetical protein
MTISLDDTVLAVRRHFRDVAWSNSTLKEWIKDAVREYSNHFPVLAAFSESAADGVYEYDFFPGAHAEENLPVVFGVVEFEYPTGEDPPEYPLRMSHTDKRFFNSGESYYDIVLHPAMNNGEIWLSSPETGDSFQVKYLTAHSWTEVESGADETCQVPAHHQPLLVQYVTWLCTREMLAARMATAEAAEETALLEMLLRRVNEEWRRYERMIETAKAMQSGESQQIHWEMDQDERIYG